MSPLDRLGDNPFASGNEKKAKTPNPFASEKSDDNPFRTERDAKLDIIKSSSKAGMDRIKKGEYIEAIKHARPAEHESVVKNALLHIYQNKGANETEGAQETLIFINTHEGIIGKKLAQKQGTRYQLKLAVATKSDNPEEKVKKIKVVLSEEGIAIWGGFRRAGLQAEIAVEKAELKLEEGYYSLKDQDATGEKVKTFLKEKIKELDKKIQKGEKLNINKALLLKALKILILEYGTKDIEKSKQLIKSLARFKAIKKEAELYIEKLEEGEKIEEMWQAEKRGEKPKGSTFKYLEDNKKRLDELQISIPFQKAILEINYILQNKELNQARAHFEKIKQDLTERERARLEKTIARKEKLQATTKPTTASKADPTSQLESMQLEAQITEVLNNNVRVEEGPEQKPALAALKKVEEGRVIYLQGDAYQYKGVVLDPSSSLVKKIKENPELLESLGITKVSYAELTKLESSKEIEIKGKKVRAFTPSGTKVGDLTKAERKLLRAFSWILFQSAGMDSPEKEEKISKLGPYLEAREMAIDRRFLLWVRFLSVKLAKELDLPIKKEEQSKVDFARAHVLQRAEVSQTEYLALFSEPITLYWTVEKDKTGKMQFYFMVTRGKKLLLEGKGSEARCYDEKDPAIKYLRGLLAGIGGQYDTPNLINGVVGYYSAHADKASNFTIPTDESLGIQHLIRINNQLQKALGMELLELRAALRASIILEKLKGKNAQEKEKYIQNLVMNNAQQEVKLAAQMAIYGTDPTRSRPISEEQAAHEIAARQTLLLIKHGETLKVVELAPELENVANQVKPSIYPEMLPSSFFNKPNAISLNEYFFALIEKGYADRKVVHYQTSEGNWQYRILGAETKKVEVPETQIPEDTKAYDSVLARSSKVKLDELKNNPMLIIKLGLLGRGVADGKNYIGTREQQAFIDHGTLVNHLSPRVIQGIIEAYGADKYQIISPVSDPRQIGALARLLLKADRLEITQEDEEAGITKGKFFELVVPELKDGDKNLIEKVLAGYHLSLQDILQIHALVDKLEVLKTSSADSKVQEMLGFAIDRLKHLVKVDDKSGNFSALINLQENLLVKKDKGTLSCLLEKQESRQILRDFAGALKAGAFVRYNEEDESKQALEVLTEEDLMGNRSSLGTNPRIWVADGFDEKKYSKILGKALGILERLGKNLKTRVVCCPKEPSQGALWALLDLNLVFPFLEGMKAAGQVLEGFAAGQMLHLGAWPTIKWIVYSGRANKETVQHYEAKINTIVTEELAKVDSLNKEQLIETLKKIKARFGNEILSTINEKEKILKLICFAKLVLSLNDIWLKSISKLVEAEIKKLQEENPDATSARILQKWQRSKAYKELVSMCADLEGFASVYKDSFNKLNEFLNDNRITKETYDLLVNDYPGLFEFGYGPIEGGLANFAMLSVGEDYFKATVDSAEELKDVIEEGFKKVGEKDSIDMTSDEAESRELKLAKKGLNRIAANMLSFINGARVDWGKAGIFALGGMALPAVVPRNVGKWLGGADDYLIKTVFGPGLLGALYGGTGVSALTTSIEAKDIKGLAENINSGKRDRIGYQFVHLIASFANAPSDQRLPFNRGIIANAIFARGQRFEQGMDLTLNSPQDKLQQATLVSEDTVQGAIDYLIFILQKVESNKDFKEKIKGLKKKAKVNLNYSNPDEIKNYVRRLKKLKDYIHDHGPIALLDPGKDDEMLPQSEDWDVLAAANELSIFVLDYFELFGVLGAVSEGNMIDPRQIAEAYGVKIENEELPSVSSSQITPEEVADKGVFEKIGGLIHSYLTLGLPDEDDKEAHEKIGKSFFEGVGDYAKERAFWAGLPVFMPVMISGRFYGMADDLFSGIKELALAATSSGSEADVHMYRAKALLEGALQSFGQTLGMFLVFEYDPLVLLRKVYYHWFVTGEKEKALALLPAAIAWGMQAGMLAYYTAEETLKVGRDIVRVSMGKDPRLAADHSPMKEKYGLIGRLLARPAHVALHRFSKAWKHVCQNKYSPIKHIIQYSGIGPGFRHIFKDGRFSGYFKKCLEKLSDAEWVKKFKKRWRSTKSAYYRMGMFSKRSRALRYAIGTAKLLVWPYEWSKFMFKLPEWFNTTKARYLNPRWYLRISYAALDFKVRVNAEAERLGRAYGWTNEQIEGMKTDFSTAWKVLNKDKNKSPEHEQNPFDNNVKGRPGSLLFAGGNPYTFEVLKKQAEPILTAFEKAHSTLSVKVDGKAIHGLKIAEHEFVEGNEIKIKVETRPDGQVAILEIGKGLVHTPKLLKAKLELAAIDARYRNLSSDRAASLSKLEPGAIDHDARAEDLKKLQGIADRVIDRSEGMKGWTDQQLEDYTKELKRRVQEAGKITEYIEVERMAQLVEIMWRASLTGEYLKDGIEYKGKILAVNGRSLAKEIRFGLAKYNAKKKVLRFEDGDVKEIRNVQVDRKGNVTGKVIFWNAVKLSDGTKVSSGRASLGEGIKIRHKQIMVGAGLRRGWVMEFGTSQGKTFAIFTGAGTEALAGKGIFAITSNEYLADRDGKSLKLVYRKAGVSCSTVKENDNIPTKQKAYRESHVAYVSGTQAIGDFINDILAFSPVKQVLGKLRAAMIDEFDASLIDEMSSFFVITTGEEPKNADKIRKQWEKTYDFIDKMFKPLEHFRIDGREGVVITRGKKDLKTHFGIHDESSPEYIEMIHKAKACLIAKYLRNPGEHFVRRGSQIMLLSKEDRRQEGRREEAGIHEAMEARHNLKITVGDSPIVTIPHSMFYKMFEILSGTTGKMGHTAKEAEIIFSKNKLKVLKVPNHIPQIELGYDSPGKNLDLKIENAIQAILEQAEQFERENRGKEGKRAQVMIRLNPADAEKVWNRIKADPRIQAIEGEMKNSFGISDPIRSITITPPRIFETIDGKAHYLYERAFHLNQDGLPVLIAAQNTYEAEVLADYFRQRGLEVNILNAPRAEAEEKVVAEGGKPGKITIITNMGGRGSDWSPDALIEARGEGIHLIMAGLRGEGMRPYFQLEGRTGRNGAYGRVEIVLCLGDKIVTESGLKIALGEMDSESAKFRFKEKIDVQVNKAGHRYIQTDAGNHKEIMGSIEEYWKAQETQSIKQHGINEVFGEKRAQYLTNFERFINALRQAGLDEVAENGKQTINTTKGTAELKAFIGKEAIQITMDGLFERNNIRDGETWNKAGLRHWLKEIFGIRLSKDFFEKINIKGISARRLKAMLVNEATSRIQLPGSFAQQQQTAIIRLFTSWKGFEKEAADLRRKLESQASDENIEAEYERKLEVLYRNFESRFFISLCRLRQRGTTLKESWIDTVSAEVPEPKPLSAPQPELSEKAPAQERASFLEKTSQKNIYRVRMENGKQIKIQVRPEQNLSLSEDGKIIIFEPKIEGQPEKIGFYTGQDLIDYFQLLNSEAAEAAKETAKPEARTEAPKPAKASSPAVVSATDGGNGKGEGVKVVIVNGIVRMDAVDALKAKLKGKSGHLFVLSETKGVLIDFKVFNLTFKGKENGSYVVDLNGSKPRSKNGVPGVEYDQEKNCVRCKSVEAMRAWIEANRPWLRKVVDDTRGVVGSDISSEPVKITGIEEISAGQEAPKPEATEISKTDAIFRSRLGRHLWKALKDIPYYRDLVKQACNLKSKKAIGAEAKKLERLIDRLNSLELSTELDITLSKAREIKLRLVHRRVGYKKTPRIVSKALKALPADKAAEVEKGLYRKLLDWCKQGNITAIAENLSISEKEARTIVAEGGASRKGEPQKTAKAPEKMPSVESSPVFADPYSGILAEEFSFAFNEVADFLGVKLKGASARAVFEEMVKISKMPIEELMQEYGIKDKETAKEFQEIAKSYRYEFERVRVLAKLAEDHGVIPKGEGRTLTLQKITELLNKAQGRLPWKEITPEKVMEFLASDEGERFLKETEVGKKFLRRIEKIGDPSRIRSILTHPLLQEVAFGMITWLIAEGLADTIGIEDPLARFAFVITAMHAESEVIKLIGTKGYRSLLKGADMVRRDMGNLGWKLLRSSRYKPLSEGGTHLGRFLKHRYETSSALELAAKAGKGFVPKFLKVLKGMAWGIGQFVLYSKLYDAFWAGLGVGRDSLVRNHYVSFGAVTTFMAVGRWGFLRTPTARGLIKALGKGNSELGMRSLLLKIGDPKKAEIIARMTLGQVRKAHHLNLKTAVKLRKLARIKTFGRALGAFGVASFLVDLMDMIYLGFHSDYEASVIQRARAYGPLNYNPHGDVIVTDFVPSLVVVSSVIASRIFGSFEEYNGEKVESSSFFNDVEAGKIDFEHLEKSISETIDYADTFLKELKEEYKIEFPRVRFLYKGEKPEIFKSDKYTDVFKDMKKIARMDVEDLMDNYDLSKEKAEALKGKLIRGLDLFNTSIALRSYISILAQSSKEIPNADLPFTSSRIDLKQYAQMAQEVFDESGNINFENLEKNIGLFLRKIGNHTMNGQNVFAIFTGEHRLSITASGSMKESGRRINVDTHEQDSYLQEAKKNLLKFRKARRMLSTMGAVIKGESLEFTQADVEAGFITKDGQINFQNEFYQEIIKTEEQIYKAFKKKYLQVWNGTNRAEKQEMAMLFNRLRINMLEKILEYLDNPNPITLEYLKIYGFTPQRLESWKGKEKDTRRLSKLIAEAAKYKGVNIRFKTGIVFNLLNRLLPFKELGLPEMSSLNETEKRLQATQDPFATPQEKIDNLIELAKTGTNPKTLQEVLSSSEEENLLRDRIKCILTDSFDQTHKKAAIRLITTYDFTDMAPHLFHNMNGTIKHETDNRIEEAILSLVIKEIESKGQSSILKNALDYIENNGKNAAGVKNRVRVLEWLFQILNHKYPELYKKAIDNRDQFKAYQNKNAPKHKGHTLKGVY